MKKEIQQELLMLRSGLLGKDINLPELVNDGILSLEAYEVYLQEEGASNTIENANNKHGKLLSAIQAYHAGR